MARQMGARRMYADAAKDTDKLKLTLALPYDTLYKSEVVTQVNVPSTSGEMGILAGHVPSIEQLQPGLVDVVEEGGVTKKFFVAGGFAIVQPDSSLSINAVEGYPLEDFSSEALKSALSESRRIAGGAGSEQEIAEAKIEVELYEVCLSLHFLSFFACCNANFIVVINTNVFPFIGLRSFS